MRRHCLFALLIPVIGVSDFNTAWKAIRCFWCFLLLNEKEIVCE
ncbi:hypothetical protein PJE062_4216 [Pseudovibrio sp. JE062]|nr:hypothetical protein PJE062_4216 [Pseudovibrio sp. JE062]